MSRQFTTNNISALNTTGEVSTLTKVSRRQSIICLLILSFVFALPQLCAQEISEELIEQTIDMLRASGQSEEQIQKVIQGMKQAQKFTKSLSTAQASGMTEQQAASKAAGFSDTQIMNMEKIQSEYATANKNLEQQALKRDIAAFQKEHANKPDATVIVDGESFSLKVLKCENNGETFNVYAEGAPIKYRQKGPQLHASRSSAYGQGGFFESLSFKDANHNNAGKSQKTGGFEGDTFAFEGVSDNEWRSKPGVSFKVNLECIN